MIELLREKEQLRRSDIVDAAKHKVGPLYCCLPGAQLFAALPFMLRISDAASAAMPPALLLQSC